MVVILKAREPARIMITIGKDEHWHLQLVQRWVIQYNFYINDQHRARMFVRMCPYLPVSARVCLNQHHWLANRMRTGESDLKKPVDCSLIAVVTESLFPRRFYISIELSE